MNRRPDYTKIRGGAQALKVAQERFGRRAVVKRVGARGPYMVGVLPMGLFFQVIGEGESWMAAFVDADHRAALDHDRYRESWKRIHGSYPG